MDTVLRILLGIITFPFILVGALVVGLFIGAISMLEAIQKCYYLLLFGIER